MSDNPATSYVPNRIALTLREDQPPSLVVNGVEIAGMIDREMSIKFSEDEDGVRSARLFVSFPVALP